MIDKLLPQEAQFVKLVSKTQFLFLSLIYVQWVNVNPVFVPLSSMF